MSLGGLHPCHPLNLGLLASGHGRAEGGEAVREDRQLFQSVPSPPPKKSPTMVTRHLLRHDAPLHTPWGRGLPASALDTPAAGKHPRSVLSSGNRKVACGLETTRSTYHRVQTGWGRREGLKDVRTLEGGGGDVQKVPHCPPAAVEGGADSGWETHSDLNQPKGPWRRTVWLRKGLTATSSVDNRSKAIWHLRLCPSRNRPPGRLLGGAFLPTAGPRGPALVTRQGCIITELIAVCQWCLRTDCVHFPL